MGNHVGGMGTWEIRSELLHGRDPVTGNIGRGARGTMGLPTKHHRTLGTPNISITIWRLSGGF